MISPPRVARRRAGPTAIALTAIALAAAWALSSCQPAPAPAPLSPQEFETRWHDLLTKRDYAGAEKVIADREKRIPDDPESIIARANMYFRQSTGPAAAFAASAKPDAGARDSSRLDTLLVRRALDTLRDGIRRHPERLDIRLGLVYLCQQMGMRIAEVQIVEETVGYAREHPGELRWLYGEPLPKPAEQFVPEVLHEYVRYYIDRGAPGDDRAMLALARIIMRGYPHSAYTANDVATFFSARRQWDRSLEFLESAEQADSTDALVLYNLGWAHEQLRQRDPALHYYRRAFETSVAARQGDIAQSARQRLVALGAAP